MYKYKEERDIAPETFMNMVCSMQYAKRYVPTAAGKRLKLAVTPH